VKEEGIERLLREGLSAMPGPRGAERLAENVMARVAAGRRRPTTGPARSARLLLAAYWLGALAASAWILSELPRPDEPARLLWGASRVLAPVAVALLLWPRAALRWAGAFLQPLLGAEPGGR
jgi:hypothetical protein